VGEASSSLSHQHLPCNINYKLDKVLISTKKIKKQRLFRMSSSISLQPTLPLVRAG
jgi:hypothetical protein